MKRIRILITVFVSFVFLVNGLYAGDIAGKVTARLAKYQKDVVVYIDKIDGKVFPPPSEPAVMDQHNLTFIPRILPLLVGTHVNFLNSDDVLHNVFSPDKIADKVNLGTYPKNEIRSKVFDKPGAAVLLCNVHPEMEAYVIVVETPYFAVTDKTGSFVIKNVPAGTYTLKVWSEKYRSEPQQVVVAASGATEATFQLAK